MEETVNQTNNRPWLWKKGQSGNPAGRPKGKTAKERAKEYLASMTDDEFENFLEGMDKSTIWEMAEGKAQSNIDHSTLGKPLVFVSPEVATKNEINSQPINDSEGLA